MRFNRAVLAGVALACAGLTLFGAKVLAQDRLSEKTLQIFDAAFSSKRKSDNPDPTLRIRSGDELFCVQERPDAVIQVTQIIDDLSSAYDLSWTHVAVSNLLECPIENTDFYIRHDTRPKNDDLRTLMQKTVGSAPPNLEELFPAWAAGYSLDLPGPGSRGFIFTEHRPDAPDFVTRAILLEELVQGILRGSDVPTNEIVSLLGENLASADYALWFEHNPSGLCAVDVILLELMLGESTKSLRTQAEMRAYMQEDFSVLHESAMARADNLEIYSDPRCWHWD